MLDLYKGAEITSGDACYCLLSDPVKNHRIGGNFTTWSVPVKEQSNQKEYFLKYTNIEDNVAIEYLVRESKFKMYYPFIVHIIDAFVGEDRAGNRLYCILSEYIDGKDLKHEREDERIVDKDIMFRQMMQLLRGVRYYTEFAKDDSYVHRDLKPANIRISKKNKRVKIIDFDWAHISASKNTETYQRTIGGTKGYTDPRAFKDNKTDLKMDIYALGRVFCFWLSGKDYFRGDEVDDYIKDGYEELAYGLKKERIPEKYQEKEYEKFIHILRRMVAPPEKRYDSISVIIKAMENFLIEFYGGVAEYEKRFHEPELLYTLKERYKKNDLTIQYRVSPQIKWTVPNIQNYRFLDIKAGNETTVMSIYCLGNKLYYVPVHPELEKEDEEGTYEIKDGDFFYFKDEKIEFVIY